MKQAWTRDAITLFSSLLLTAGCFVADTFIPAGITCVIGYLVIMIIFLFYHTTRKDLIFGLAFLFTVLTFLGAGFSLNRGIMINPFINRGLTVLVIWAVAGWGIRYKQRQEREMYLAAIVNSSEDAVLGKSLTGRIMYWNKGAETLYGYRFQEVVGEPIDAILFPEDREANQQLLQRIGRGESIHDHETVRRHKDGSAIDVSLSISPITNNSGEIIGASEFARDITARKKEHFQLVVEKELAKVDAYDTQQELDKAQKELQQSRRLSDIGTLAATVAHELRNPLGVIRTAVYNVKRKRANEQIDKHLANIEKKVKESELIINNLLNYSRIKMPARQEVNVIDLLEECVQSTLKRFHGRDIDVQFKNDVSPKVTIYADPLQLKEVFDNILNNAVQATPVDGGSIEVAVAGAAEGELDVTVTDSGEGIDPDDLKEVFKPFFTRKSKGTGLGLAICKEIIDLHDGTIDVASTKGAGARVTVRLPARKES